jgi:hypothetical protein
METQQRLLLLPMRRRRMLLLLALRKFLMRFAIYLRSLEKLSQKVYYYPLIHIIV